MSETCLVTGACGFNGRHMVELLVNKGHRVRASDLRNTCVQDFERLGVEFIAADLTDPRSLEPLVRGIEWVFHPASLFDYTAPYEALARANVVGTRNLGEVCCDNRVQRFVLWSSIGVYGALDRDRFPADESAPLIPSNNLEKSKREQERTVMDLWETRHLPAIILRPEPIYGPRSCYGIYQLIYAVAKGWLGICSSAATNRLPFVHVDDVIGAAYHLAQQPETVGQAYNVVDDSHYTIFEVLEYLATVTGGRMVSVPVPNTLYRGFLRFCYRIAAWNSRRIYPRRPRIEADTLLYGLNDYVFSNEKLKRTGYELQHPDFKLGVLTAIAWYQREGIF